MLTDSYGGLCPNCGYDRMLLRYGSWGYYQYDACPNCAFSFGCNECNEQDHNCSECADNWEFWEDEIRFFGDSIPEQSLLGILLYIESLPDVKERESVFDYTHFNWKRMEWTLRFSRGKIV